MRRLVLALVTVSFLPAAAAHARQLQPNDAGEEITAYDARGPVHLAAVVRFPGDGTVMARLRRSADDGRTWTTIFTYPSDERGWTVSVEPDGSGWAGAVPVGSYGAAPGLVRVGPTGETSSVAAPSGTSEVTAPVTVGEQRLAAVVTSSAELRLQAVDATGAATGPSTLVATDASTPPVLTRDAGGVELLSRDRGWDVHPDGSFAELPAPLHVRLPAGRTLLRGTFYTQIQPGFWRPAADAAGPQVAKVLPDGPRVLLLPEEVGPREYGSGQRGAALLDSPDPPTSLGPLGPDTQVLVDRSNALRRVSGLPDLLGDPAISNASRNHAGYGDRSDEGHDETPGREGFTGRSPSARCAAVGTVCGSEIYFGGVAGSAAVDGWWATPFHRLITGDPASVSAGGGTVGHTSVMNGGPLQTIVTRPVGLPVGRWTGPLGFAGESPDPGAPCGMSPPYGLAITAYPYVDDVRSTDAWQPGGVTLVDLTAGGTAVPGCARGAYLVPAKALVPGHRYRGTALYELAGAARPFSWEFDAVGDGTTAAPAVTTPAVKAPARTTTKPAQAKSAAACLRILAPRRSATVRRGRTMRVRVRSCRPGRLVVTLRSRGRAVRTVGRAPAGKAVGVTLRRTTRLRRGSATLTAVAGGKRATVTLRLR